MGRDWDYEQPDDGELQPLEPREAMEMWLSRLQSDRADETLQTYRYRMLQFVEWCEGDGEIENLNDLTGRDVWKFDAARREKDLSTATLNNQMGTLRQFMEFCVSIDAVSSDIPIKVDVPELDKEARTSDEKLTPKRAEVILRVLERFEHASRRHALLNLLWHTACRLGGAHALDVEDCYLEERDLRRLLHIDDIDEDVVEEVEPPFIYFRHRDGTPLKNKKDGERPVAISEEVAAVLKDYIDVKRHDVNDEDSRRPLFTTQKGDGRMSKGALRRTIYILTQPCRFGDCPHGRDTDDCEALVHGQESRCPSARSPHPIRTGSITWHRNKGWEPIELAERVNATPEVIRDHYFHPEPLQRMQKRRGKIENLEDDS